MTRCRSIQGYTGYQGYGETQADVKHRRDIQKYTPGLTQLAKRAGNTDVLNDRRGWRLLQMQKVCAQMF